MQTAGDDGNEPPRPAGRRRHRVLPVVVLLVLVAGVGLRTAQYLGAVDMWHDELALARNVDDRGVVELLTRPLDHRQVAPVGFLALLEISSSLLGVSEPGLRLVPWLMSLAALLLFWRIARRLVHGWGRAAAVAVFAVSPALIWYSSSVKPYGTDITMSLLLVWLALRHLERPRDRGRGVVAGGVGAVALLVSFPAVPTAAILGVILAVAWWRRRPRADLAPLAALGTGWAVGAAAAGSIALSLLDPTTDSFMRDFWAEDFPPLGRPVAAVAWSAGKLWRVFAHSVVFYPPEGSALTLVVALPVALATVGLLFGWRERDPRVTLLLAPGVAALAAAFAHLLPLDNRLGLHATWPVLVLAGVGLDGLAGISTGRWRWAPRGLSALMALPLAAFVLLVARPPYAPGDEVPPRSVLRELARRHRPGDRIYVYTQARHDIAFYGGREGLEDWVQGTRHYDEPREYLREIDTLRGNPRVWFFWVRLDRDEPGWIRDYLGAIGRELERIPDGELDSTGAVLYDLSDPERLRAASADTFPVEIAGERGPVAPESTEGE